MMPEDNDHRMLMTAKIATMLEMQDSMNARVDADWLEHGREWYRAIWIECAELMDHYGGWKWWKKSARDDDQVMLEVVDIWHFGLSMRIDKDRDYDRAAVQIAEEWAHARTSRGFLCDVEDLANYALTEQGFAVDIVPALLAEIGRGFDDLYRAYIGKNVLNFFRQDNGYRDGSYIKTWHGREDNEHLVEVLAGIDANDPAYRDLVYRGLSERYPRQGN